MYPLKQETPKREARERGTVVGAAVVVVVAVVI